MKIYLHNSLRKTGLDELLQQQIKAEVSLPLDEKGTESPERYVELKKECDLYLYVMSPAIESFDVVVDAIDDSNKHPAKTMFYYYPSDKDKAYTPHQVKSLDAVGKMVRMNGGKWFESENEMLQYINNVAAQGKK